MRNILKYLLIDRQFEFDGQRTELVESIGKVKGINIKKVDSDKIKIYPWISVGTLVAKNGGEWIEGINVKAVLSDNDSTLTRIRFSTHIRPEHGILAGVFILFFIFLPLDNELTYKLITDWLVAHIGFQFVYRIQEELLIGKLTSRLRLVKI